jgi:hypothetical protein
MSDLLKEAIADAKAVRETALANAKMALEEAFTPQLKSMLSAKLKEDEFGEGEGEEEFGGEEEIPAEEPEAAFAAPEEDEFGGEEEIPAEEPAIAAPEEDEFGGEEEIPAAEPEVEEGIIEINGVQYAPVVSEDDEMGDEEEMGIEDDGNLDLEAIIRELETEINEEDDAYDETAGSSESSHLAEEDDAYDENSENVSNPESGDGNDMDGVAALKSEGEEGGDEELEIDESIFTEDDDDEEIDENNDVSSGIGGGMNSQPSSQQNSAQTEDPIDSTEVEDMDGVAAIKAENVEYKKAIIFMKDKLHEVNILNAKLLFTNKLFKEFALDNNQKLKVVETFDRTQSTREIKLVYSTLAEQFSDNSSTPRKNPIRESASVKSGSTKPSQKSRKVITEEDQVANRFKKLAGIING